MSLNLNNGPRSARSGATIATMRELELGLPTAGMLPELLTINRKLHEPSPKVFQRTWQCVQPDSEAPSMWSHSSPGPPAPPKAPQPDSCRIDPSASKNSHVSGRRNFMPAVLIGSLSWQIFPLAATCAEMLPPQMNPGFHLQGRGRRVLTSAQGSA